MSPRLQPAVRCVLIHTLAPASEGTVTRRWSTRPLADPEAFSEGRVISYGPIERAMSAPDGDYQIASCDVRLTDADGFFRGLMAEPETRYITAREAAIELLSEAGRAAELDWRPLLRGRVTDLQTTLGREATLRIADIAGSYTSGFDLEKTIGVRMTNAIIPGLPREAQNRIFPIVVGEFNDGGAVDENGDAADKGMLPFIYAGLVSIGADNTVLYDNLVLPRLSPPQNVTGVVAGTAGARVRTYGFTFFSQFGETLISQEFSVAIPDNLGDEAYVEFSWDAAPEGAVAVGVYINKKRAELLDAGYTTFRDNGSSSASGPPPPRLNTAYIDHEIDGVAYQVHGMMVHKIGAASEVFNTYGSNLASGETPKRIRLPESVYPTQVKIYGRPGYPHADPFIVLNGVQFAVAYVRGPLLDHHIRGIVTMAWNGCGDDDVGDGSGPTITEAFYQLQHILNEYAFKDDGLGYQSGTFGPLEAYSNGVPKVRPSAFEACQDKTVEWIGGRGYQGSIAITVPTSLREFLRRFNATFASHVGTNHHGQIYPILIDDTADPDEGQLYTDRINVIRMVDVRYAHDLVETRVVYHYDFDPDSNEFRIVDQVVEDEAATEAHGGVPRVRSVRQCFYTRDTATAFDANSRHLSRYKLAPRYAVWEVDFEGLENELGSQVRLNHYELSDSNEPVPFVVTKHRTHPDNPNSVILEGFDLQRISTLAFPLLTDKTTGDGNLFDKTSLAAPPVGAFELR